MYLPSTATTNAGTNRMMQVLLWTIYNDSSG